MYHSTPSFQPVFYISFSALLLWPRRKHRKNNAFLVPPPSFFPKNLFNLVGRPAYSSPKKSVLWSRGGPAAIGSPDRAGIPPEIRAGIGAGSYPPPPSIRADHSRGRPSSAAIIPPPRTQSRRRSFRPPPYHPRRIIGPPSSGRRRAIHPAAIVYHRPPIIPAAHTIIRAAIPSPADHSAAIPRHHRPAAPPIISPP